MSDMYDEKWRLKPEYNLSEAQKKSMTINNDIKAIDKIIYPEREIDPLTDIAFRFAYRSVDGKEWTTYEDAMAYNQWYYEKMIRSKENKGMRK